MALAAMGLALATVPLLVWLLVFVRQLDQYRKEQAADILELASLRALLSLSSELCELKAKVADLALIDRLQGRKQAAYQPHNFSQFRKAVENQSFPEAQ